MTKDNKTKKTAIIQDVKYKQQEKASDYSKVTELLLNKQFRRRKTFLNNNRQVGLITTLDVIAQLYDIPFLKKYISDYCEYLTSIEGQGRKDIVDISKFRFDESEKKDNMLLELARGR